MGQLYDAIQNDSHIINLYKNIEISEDSEKLAYANHNFNHVKNVSNIVENILIDLKHPKEIIESSKIAALLHDLGCIEGKENHAYRSYLIAKDYLKAKDLKYKEDILDAIKNHSDGFTSDKFMTLTLTFADKLDITGNRLTPLGRTIEGVRQIQYINNIKVSISSNQLIVRFLADEKVDQEELEKKFYFIPKVSKSINSFANKIKLEPCIFFNNKPWEI